MYMLYIYRQKHICIRVITFGGAQCISDRDFGLHSEPYTLNPTPYTLHPEPYTLHPAP
jgi:hypothetical protein